MPRIPNGKVSVGLAPQREGWNSFQFNVLNFAAIDATKGNYLLTPEFSCNRHRWGLEIYPGGFNLARDGCVSVYLTNRSEGGISATFEMKILNKFGGDNYNRNQLTFFYLPTANVLVVGITFVHALIPWIYLKIYFIMMAHWQ